MRVIVAVPLVAVIGFAGLALFSSIRQSEQADALGIRVRLASHAGELAHELQRERAAAADLLTAAATAQQTTYGAQTARTDAAVARYRAQRAQAPDGAPATRAALTRIDRALDGLSALRTQVRTAAQASVSAMTFSYRIVIADLLSYREAAAQGIAATDLADNIRAAAALSIIAESVGQEQVAVLRAVAGGQLTPALQQDITAARAGFNEATVSFTGLARPAWRTWWEHAGSGPEALALQRLRDQVSRARPGGRLALDTDAWITVTQAWLARQLSVQRRVDAAVRSDVEDAKRQRQRRALAEGTAMAIAILLTLAVTGAVARQITNRLRRLRDTANTIAYTKLPAMVAELRAAGGAPVDPRALVAASDSGLEMTAEDEIGDVGQAFSAVHRAAIHTAAEQAVMRANTAQIFVHLSRREQRLVDAVLAQVDRVEQDETDPERLDRLYALDHLATRMARINASLLVLGGVGVGRVRHTDVSLPEVLQAALSQIEHYTRVRLGIVDPGFAVFSEAVDEVVHLLAELMDNATSYSPPDTEAWATARGLGDRVIVQIGDEGVGLPPQRLLALNALLAEPPAADVAAVRAMGLVVVGQLAARLGALVELRPGPRLGTIAEVTLPAALIRPAPRTPELPAAPSGTSKATGPTPDGRTPGDPWSGGTWPGGTWPDEAPSGGTWPDGTPQRGALPSGTLPDEASPDGSITAELPVAGHAPAELTFHGRHLAHEPTRHRQLPPGAGHPTLGAAATERTRELPIFQQVNSWFQAGRGDHPQWRGPADDGWRTAAEAAHPDVTATTEAGLPVRVPQRHLVPGAVDPPAGQRPDTDRRDPARVAAAMSAFARGVAGRRPALATAATSDSSTTADATGSTSR